MRVPVRAEAEFPDDQAAVVHNVDCRRMPDVVARVARFVLLDLVQDPENLGRIRQAGGVRGEKAVVPLRKDIEVRRNRCSFVPLLGNAGLRDNRRGDGWPGQAPGP